MIQELVQDIVLARWPDHLSGLADLHRDGMVIKDQAGRVVGHMEEACRAKVPTLGGLNLGIGILNLGVSIASFAYMRGQFQTLNRRLDRIEANIDKIDRKMDLLIGMVAQVDRKVDAVGGALAALAGKIDSRHRDVVFAEIGAVLDTLAYVDRKEPAEAQTLVASNITGVRKAIRLFENLIEEYEDALPEGDFGRIETLRMRLLSSLLSGRVDIAMGEVEAAHHVAQETAKLLDGRSGDLLGRWLEVLPLDQWVEPDDRSGLAAVVGLMEQVDGVSPLDRLAGALLAKPRQKIRSMDSSAEMTVVYCYKKERETYRAGDPILVVRDANDKSLYGPRFGPDETTDEWAKQRYGSTAKLIRGEVETSHGTQLEMGAAEGYQEALQQLGAISGAARGVVVETALLVYAPEAVSSLRGVLPGPFQGSFVLDNLASNAAHQ